MQSKYFLQLSDLKVMAAAAEAEANKNQWAVTFAIVDDGGHLLWLQRLDGAAPIPSSKTGKPLGRLGSVGLSPTRMLRSPRQR